METPTLGFSPLVPKGTAMALSFSAALVPAQAWAERLVGRYDLGMGAMRLGAVGEVAPVRAALGFPWIFPRAWFLQDRAGRGKAAPRWLTADPMLDGEGAATLDVAAGAPDMPMVAPAGGAGAGTNRDDASARTWAAAFATLDVPAALAGTEPHRFAPGPWQPRALGAIGVQAPATMAHLAWSDAVLTHVVRGPHQATPRAAPRSLQVPEARPFATAAFADVPAAEAIPRFAPDEEVSDDVFAAIARPTGPLAPRPATAGPALGPTVARLDPALADAPADAALAPSPFQFDDMWWAASASPVGLGVRLADARAARVAPHLFASGEVPAPREANAQIFPHAPIMPVVATATGRLSPVHGIEQAQAQPPPQPRDDAQRLPVRYLPGARGFAAAAQAAAVTASVSQLALEFLTPAEVQAARAMGLPPTSWTTGVRLAAAGEAAVAAKWADVEQLAVVAPSAARRPATPPLGAAAHLPRGAYQWPASAMDRWQQADVTSAADGGNAAGPPSPALYQAFGAVWSETMVRQRVARHPAGELAEAEAPAPPSTSLALAATSPSSLLSPPLSPSSPSSPSSPPSPPSSSFSPSPAAAIAAAFVSATDATASRPLGGRLAADALDYRVAIASAGSRAQPSAARAAPPGPLVAPDAGDVSARVMTALTYGLGKDDLPPAVAAWVAQFETAVAADRQLVAVPSAALGEALAATPRVRPPFTGPPAPLGMRAPHDQDEARADHAAEVAGLTSSYVVPKTAGGGGHGRHQLSQLHPHEMAALLQASASASTSASGAGAAIATAASGLFGGHDPRGANLTGALSERAVASVMAGLNPMLDGDGGGSAADPSLYEMTMIAALGQAAPAALAARTTDELVPPAPAAAVGPSAAAPLDIEAEAQQVLREVLHQIAALRDRNGEF